MIRPYCFWSWIVLASVFPCWGASIQGYVKDQSGVPVKGATLLLTRNVSVSNNLFLAFPLGRSIVFVGEANPPTEGEAWYHVSTDEAGRYKRGGIPSGHYNVQVFFVEAGGNPRAASGPSPGKPVWKLEFSLHHGTNKVGDVVLTKMQ